MFFPISSAQLTQNSLPEDALTNVCKTKNLDIVKLAIEKKARPDSATFTWACLSGNIQIIEAVIQVEAKPDDKTFNAACATHQLVIVKKAFQQGAKPSSETLTMVCKTESLEMIQEIIKMGALPDQNTVEALFENKLIEWDPIKRQVLQDILRLGIKPTSKAIWSAFLHYPQFIEDLLKAEFQLEEENNLLTMFFDRYGYYNSSCSMLKKLAQKGGGADEETFDKALTASLWNTNAEYIRIAIEAGAEWKKKSSPISWVLADTLIDFVICYTCRPTKEITKIIKILLKAGFKPTQHDIRIVKRNVKNFNQVLSSLSIWPSQEDLKFAALGLESSLCYSFDDKVLKLLLSPPPISIFPKKKKAQRIQKQPVSTEASSLPKDMLTLACKTGDLGKVNEVIATGVKPDHNTLNEACIGGNEAIVVAVLKAGARSNKTTLSKACSSGNVEIVKAVLKADAEPSEKTLTIACKGTAPDIFEIRDLVIAFGALPNKDTINVLFESSLQNDVLVDRSYFSKILLRILQLGAKPNEKSLRYSIKYAPEFICHFLRANTQLSQHPTILTDYLKCNKKKEEIWIFASIAQMGAKPDKETFKYALHAALKQNNSEFIRIAVQAGAELQTEIEDKHMKKFSLTQYVLNFNSQAIDVIKILLQAGLKPTQEDINFVKLHTKHLIEILKEMNFIPNKDDKRIAKNQKQQKSMKMDPGILKLLLNPPLVSIIPLESPLEIAIFTGSERETSSEEETG